MDAEFEKIKMIQKERFAEKVPKEKISQEMIFSARREVANVKFSDAVGHYGGAGFATRYPLRFSKQLEVMIDVGVSPKSNACTYPMCSS